MGRIRNATIGVINGKVGNLVGASWKGTGYYRIHSEHVNDARTPRQLVQRERFKSISFLMHKLRTTVIKPVWNGHFAHMTGNNAFMSKNMQAVGADASIDYSKLVLATGSVDGPVSMKLVKDPMEEGSYNLTWVDNDMLYDVDGSDELYVVIFNEADVTATPVVMLQCAARKELLYTLSLNGDAGDKLHVFAYFGKADGSDFCESSHFAITL